MTTIFQHPVPRLFPPTRKFSEKENSKVFGRGGEKKKIPRKSSGGTPGPAGPNGKTAPWKKPAKIGLKRAALPTKASSDRSPYGAVHPERNGHLRRGSPSDGRTW